MTLQMKQSDHFTPLGWLGIQRQGYEREWQLRRQSQAWEAWEASIRFHRSGVHPDAGQPAVPSSSPNQEERSLPSTARSTSLPALRCASPAVGAGDPMLGATSGAAISGDLAGIADTTRT